MRVELKVFVSVCGFSVDLSFYSSIRFIFNIRRSEICSLRSSGTLSSITSRRERSPRFSLIFEERRPYSRNRRKSSLRGCEQNKKVQ